MRFLPLFCSLSAFSSAAFAQTAPKIWDFSDARAAPIVTPYAAPGGVASHVDIATTGGVLRLTNRAGGSFGAKIGIAPFDAAQFPRLDFDYTRSDDAKINFFFKVNGAYYGVIFSGPPRVRPGSFLLGTIPNVGAKGHATIPLRDWLRRFVPQDEVLSVEEILVGNWDNMGYLLAGIGGNGPGATWTLDNLALSNPEVGAPRLAKPLFDGNQIVWPLENGTDLDTRGATLTVDDQKFDFSSPFLKLETGLDARGGLSHRVVLQAGEAGIGLKDSQNLKLVLDARDSRGKKVEGGSAALDFHLGSHLAPVPLPRVTFGELGAPLPLAGGDFEADQGGWSGNDAIVERDAGGASGAYALRFHNPRTAAPFSAKLAGEAIDVAQFPVLTFAYRADERLRADFRLMWEGKGYSVRWFDRDNPQQRLGSIANVVADGKWHTAQVPLLEWMKKARPDATTFSVSGLGVGDEGWLGNARGVVYWLDDFRFAPKMSGALHAEVTARDLSGVNAVSWQIDQNPETVPDRSPEGGPKLDIPLADRGAGLYWLHVRAQNSAGSWSETAHVPFAVG